MSLFKYIDPFAGINKFNGDERQFINMLSMFEKLTLNDSMLKVYSFLKNDQAI